MKIVTEKELLHYRKKVGENNYVVVMIKLKNCTTCEKFFEVFESVESIFPEITFCVFEVEKPEKVPLFATPSSPAVYLFIDGYRIMEYSGITDKAGLKKIIKSWVLGQ